MIWSKHGLAGSAMALILLGWGMPCPAGEKPAQQEAPKESAETVQPNTHRRAALEARLVLKVIRVDKVRDVLLDEVKRLGGFPLLIENSQLILKVPPSGLTPLLKVAADQGWALNKSFQRQDLDLEITKLERRIASKQKMLDKLRAFFDDSDVAATLRIEREMVSQVQQLESLKGQLKLLLDRVRWARITIVFNFQRRDRIVDAHSPFEWVNTANLNQFLTEY